MKIKHNFRRKGMLGILLAAVLCVTAFSGCGSARGEEKIRTFSIDTAYGKLEFPEQFRENLKHEEVTEGNVTAEVFTMVNGETEREFCRMVFGDAAQGELIGYYDQTPVTLVINGRGGVAFPDLETEELYFSMMDCINMLIDSLAGSGGFQAGGVPNFESNTAVQMKYWKIELPDAITWEETTQGDAYKVTFFGMAGEARVELYTIWLDDPDAQEILGKYTAEGAEKLLSVEYAPMDQLEGFSDDDLAAAYAMFDTINDVMNQIRQSRNFSDQLEEEEPAA